MSHDWVFNENSSLQVAAAGSLAAGDITYDNVHKAIFGFNQGQEGRRLLSEETKVTHSSLFADLCHALVEAFFQ